VVDGPHGPRRTYCSTRCRVEAKRRDRAPEPGEQLVARQRQHRLEVRVRPEQPATSNCDPWQLCDEGLEALDRIGQELPLHGRATADLRLARERLRQLAWGVEE
jgi:hypothetical protein